MGFAAGNAQHIGARPQQQDAFGFSDPGEQAFVGHGGFLGIVADGVGGLTHGSEASQSAVRTFLQAYHLKSPQETIPEALARSIREANAAVLRVNSEAAAEGAGTTLVAAVLHDQSLYWISAGDSRIYLLRAGRLTRITSDHTYGRQLDEQAAQGKISRSEAQNNSERGSLTSYLGQPEPKELDRNTRPLALQPDDNVILCSDGFYRALNESEIAGGFHDDLQRACETLVGQAVAKQRKGQDNLTVIALKERGRSRRRGHDRGGKGSALPVYASAVVILALLSAGAAYWYRNPPASSPQVKQTQPEGPGSSASQGEGTSTKEVETVAPENPPRTETKQEADTSAGKSVPRRQQKLQSKRKVSTAPKVATAPQREAGATRQNASGGAQPTTPAPTTPAQSTPAQSTPASSSPPGAAPSQGMAGDAASAPASQSPPAAATPANPPAGTGGTTPAPAPNSGGDQQKPPTTPPPADDTKPNGPPSVAFGAMTGAALPAQLKDDLGTKDGKNSCHS